MANKRQLKKYIHNVCGDLAAEIISAYHCFDGVQSDKVGEIVGAIAELQCNSLAKVSVAHDKKKGSAHAEYKALVEEFNKEVVRIVAMMNAALPEEAHKEMKEAAK